MGVGGNLGARGVWDVRCTVSLKVFGGAYKIVRGPMRV